MGTLEISSLAMAGSWSKKLLQPPTRSDKGVSCWLFYSCDDGKALINVKLLMVPPLPDEQKSDLPNYRFLAI